MTSIELFKAQEITTLDQWRKAWHTVGTFERDRQWMYGDLFVLGERFIQTENDRFYTWDEISAQILKLISHVGIDQKTLIKWGILAKKFPEQSRFKALTWSHHREVVDFPLKTAMVWLRQAEIHSWSVEDLRQQMAEKNGGRSSGPPIAVFVPRKAVSDQVRWFRLQFEDTPLEDWPQERRAALKREYQPLMDILQAL